MACNKMSRLLLCPGSCDLASHLIRLPPRLPAHGSPNTFCSSESLHILSILSWQIPTHSAEPSSNVPSFLGLFSLIPQAGCFCVPMDFIRTSFVYGTYSRTFTSRSSPTSI